MFIPGLCDIVFLCLNMRIEAYNGSYNMEIKNQHFDNQDDRHEENSKFEEGVDKSPLVNENVHTWLE